MRVTIVDVDWYNGDSKTPNPNCQKLSSYYKQLGGIVNFPLNNIEAGLVADVVYVVREGKGQVPPAIPVRAEHVNLLGETFEFYDRHLPDIPAIVKACRPDYTLYPEAVEEQEAANHSRKRRTNILQFFDGDKRLPKVQDDRRGEGTGPLDNLIVDKGFWNKSVEDIEALYSTLKKRRNIMYQDDLEVTSLLQPRKFDMFASLHHRRSKYRVGLRAHSAEEVDSGIALLSKLAATSSNLSKPQLIYPLPIVADDNTFFREYGQALHAAYTAKSHKAHLAFIAPERETTPYWGYWEELEAWSTYDFTSSYIEHMTFIARYMTYRPIEGVIYSNKWMGSRAKHLRDLLELIPIPISKWGYLEWGDRSYYNKIDFRRIFDYDTGLL